MKDKHKALYAQLPSFKCKPGCSECCGPMPCHSPWEWEQLDVKITPTTFDCPYHSKDGCNIYEKRFFMCRFYGNVDGVACPKGFGPEKLLTRENGRGLRKQYFELY